MASELLPQFFIFDTLTHLVIILCCYIMYTKTKDLFGLSLERGIKYFCKSFMFYTWCFSLRYVSILLEYLGFFEKYSVITPILQPMFTFFILYAAIIGGFYLAYSLMWRKYEGRFLEMHMSAISHFAAITIAAAEVLLIFQYHMRTNYIFFTVMIAILLSAIYYSKEHSKGTNISLSPYISVVGLSLGVYSALFLEGILIYVLPTIHFYVWGLVAIFVVSSAYNVIHFSE